MDLICYLSNGYPTIDASIKMAQEYVDAGTDIIEIDFPSSDPYLESDLIAGRMAKALEVCHDFDAYMEGMTRAKKALPQTHFILLVYENTVEEIGVEKFIDFCKHNDFMDIIFVGLKDDVIKNQLIANGLKVSCYVQSQMDEAEIASAIQSNGFVYMQAKGTPEQINPKYPELKDCIAYLRSRGISRPIYCGVGVHTPSDAAMVKAAGGDGAFIGSAILKLHDDLPAMKAKIREFKAAC